MNVPTGVIERVEGGSSGLQTFKNVVCITIINYNVGKLVITNSRVDDEEINFEK